MEVLGGLAAETAPLTTGLASLQAPRGLAPAHLGALESGLGGSLIALGAIGVAAGMAAGAAGLGAAGGAAFEPAHAPSPLAEPRASHAERPSLAQESEGMRSQGASCRTPCSLPS